MGGVRFALLEELELVVGWFCWGGEGVKGEDRFYRTLAARHYSVFQDEYKLRLGMC